MDKLFIKNGKFINPEKNSLFPVNLLIDDGKILDFNYSCCSYEDAFVIDATNFYIAPGLMDLHVHFRDPGYIYKEDLFSGAKAAAAGGVTAVCTMPNTSPVTDSPEVLEYIKNKALETGIDIYPCAAISDNQKSLSLCDFAALKKAGAYAVSDDGRPVEDILLMETALIEAKKQGLLVISHCEDLKIVNGGIINKGEISEKLGVAGIDRLSEDLVTKREIDLAKKTGCPVHIAHVSTKGSVDIIRKAKKEGVLVTAETCAHYLLLTDEMLLSEDADYRMNPPLRTNDDKNALIEGLIDGTIDIIVTDHAPHAKEEKENFLKAPNGVVGLETSFSACVTALVKTGYLTYPDLIYKMAIRPREILGVKGGSLNIGDSADLFIFAPNEKWIVQPDKLHSKSKNTAFKGMTLDAPIKYTISKGKIIYTNN